MLEKGLMENFTRFQRKINMSRQSHTFYGYSWAYEEYSLRFCAMLKISVNTNCIWSKKT
jgi:hypothetical protein